MSEKPYLGVKVEGLNRLTGTLRAAGAEIQELKDLNLRAAQTVLQAAIASAPVGDSRGGHIRDSLRAAGTQRMGIIRAGGAKQPYGNYIHWNNKLNRYQGNPWLSNAAQQTEPIWVAFYFKELERITDKVSGDL